MTILPYLLLYLIAAAVASGLVIIAWQRRYYRGGRPFTLLMAATGWWLICRTLSIIDPNPTNTALWLLLQYVGVVLVGPSWLLLAMAYTGQWWRTNRPLRIGVFVPGLLMLLLALTNDYHGLWWSAVAADPALPFPGLRAVGGPAFWAHTAYAYCCVVGGAAFFAHAAWRGAAQHRYPARMMLISALVPVLGNLGALVGVMPLSAGDPTPLLLLVAGSMTFYATMRYRLVDLAPLAEREIFAGMPDGIVVIDSLGQVAEANDLAPALLGVPGGRWAGHTLVSLCARSPVADDLRSFLREAPGARSRQITYTQSDGLHALELRMRPLLAANGVATGALLLIRDISERVRVERDRARHLAELGMVTDMARIANSASETDQLLHTFVTTIVEASEWERVAVGLLDEAGSGLSVVVDHPADADHSFEGELIAGADAQELLALIHAGRTRQLGIDEEAVRASAIGKEMRRSGLRSLLMVPLYHQGSPLGVLALGRRRAHPDSPTTMHLAETIGELITDAVVRTRLYDKARQADRLKSAFLATISHELRTPLTAIIGYTEMLQKGIYGQLSDRMREPLTYMHLSSMTLLRLITDIVDFSRLEAGYLEVDLMPVDLLRAVEHVVGQLQPQIRERGLELRLAVPGDLPPVRANGARIEQVLSNLVVNAVKFTDAGTITISAARQGDRVRLSVQDTGIGIAPEHMETIFQEFRRVESPNGRRYSGAGLGLAICRRLIGLMGGTISVASEPHVGSTFTIELPVAELLEQEARPVERARGVGARG